MKFRKLKGVLFTLALIGGLVILAATTWKPMLAGLIVLSLAVLALIILGISLIGGKLPGDRWDKQ